MPGGTFMCNSQGGPNWRAWCCNNGEMSEVQGWCCYWKFWATEWQATVNTITRSVWEVCLKSKNLMGMKVTWFFVLFVTCF